MLVWLHPDDKSLKKMEKLQENTKKNRKESFNGTPKPNSMGCCQNKGTNLGPKVLEGKKFEFIY